MSKLNVINWQNVEFGEKIEILPLAHNAASKEIRIVMPKDCVMKEHQAPFAIFVQVLRGRIWFACGEERVEMGEGEMVSLVANEPHSLGGLENSVVRLSLGVGDSVERVSKVLKL